MGLILGAFWLAYALFEIPSGWLGDRYGARRTLMRIVLAEVLRRAELRVAPGYRARPVLRAVTVGPSRGMPVVLIGRYGSCSG